jgi:hypothetical protein
MLRRSKGDDREAPGIDCGREETAEKQKRGGAERDRTDDLLSAIQALSQLSYSPTFL